MSHAQAEASVAEHAPAAPEYIGLVTRTTAFAVDAALINLTAIVVGVAVGLGLSVLAVPNGVEDVVAVIGGVAFVGWTIGYFVTFWSTTGQTPGSRLLRIEVRHGRDGGVPRPRQAFVRFVGMVLAAIPLGAGFLPILVDDRRRGLHDLLAHTVVVGVGRQGA